jgi:hypothetical protein
MFFPPMGMSDCAAGAKDSDARNDSSNPRAEKNMLNISVGYKSAWWRIDQKKGTAAHRIGAEPLL